MRRHTGTGWGRRAPGPRPSGHDAPIAETSVLPERSPQQRLRQGGALLLGALVLALVLGDDPRRFFYVPIGLGAVYLLSALAGGRRGSYWATALVLLGWGAAVVLVREARPDLDTAGLYLLGAGLGMVAGLLLARWGLEVDPLGLAGTVVFAGAILAFAPQVAALTEARTFALAVGLVGLVNVVRGLVASR